MAPVGRRPGTRSNPSSTQEVDAVAFPPLRLDGEEELQDYEQALTQNDVNADGVNNSNFVITDEGYDYSPQYDNPSSLMPDNEDDYALKEYMASQQQISQRFEQEIQNEFDLDLDNDDSSVAEEVNNNNVPPYTQGTLDAASILVSGFDTTSSSLDVANNVAADHAAEGCPGFVRREKPDDPDDLEDDNDFMKKYHEYNKKHNIVARALDPDDDKLIADEIANNLRKYGITGLSEEEQAKIANCKQGKNKSKYMSTQQSLKKRFFDTLGTYGGHLSVLAQQEKPNPWDLSDESPMDKRWFAVVGGPKNAS